MLAKAVIASVGRASFDGELPAMRHGIARVECQIEQYLLDLPGISPDLPQVLAEFNLHLNVLPNYAGEHPARLFHLRVEAEHLQALHLLAAECEQLARQIGGSPR